jgi:hypothetical protein
MSEEYKWYDSIDAMKRNIERNEELPLSHAKLLEGMLDYMEKLERKIATLERWVKVTDNWIDAHLENHEDK